MQRKDTRSIWPNILRSSLESHVFCVYHKLYGVQARELKTSKTRHNGPLPINYQPELDVISHYDKEHASRYRQIIGIFQWAIMLGRIDILTEVALLSAVLERELLAQISYTAINTEPYHTRRVDKSVFPQGDWTDFYGPVVEEDPLHMPVPLGNPVKMLCFVDADHAGNTIPR